MGHPPRFYCVGDALSASVTIEGDDAHHIKNVLRLGTGDSIIVCDGKGREALCQITTLQKSYATAEVKTVAVSDVEPITQMHVYPSLSKGERFEWMLQKLTELGVRSITPVLSEYCVAKEPDSAKIQRWQRIILEAAKQCGRACLPELRQVVSFSDAIGESKRYEGCKALFCYENERNSLRNALSGASQGKIVLVLSGPEGGYSDNEAIKAVQAGWESVSLGKIILRCETAPLAAVSAILFACGDM